jgi:NADP-reducing hydrogenase subunit HndB
MADKKKAKKVKPAARKPVSRRPAAKKKPVAPQRSVRKASAKKRPASKPASRKQEVKRLSIQDLAKIRDETRAMLTIRDGQGRSKVTVHMGTCGIAAGAREIMNALLNEMRKKGVKDVIVTTSGCAGLCSREPMATVELKGRPPVKYVDLTPPKIGRILVEHVLGGRPVTEYALAVGSETLY